MAKDSILFTMANPDPEILPHLAKEAGAKVVGTGRSDFPNQVNNVLVFPGIFKGALEGHSTHITSEMKLLVLFLQKNYVRQTFFHTHLTHRLLT